MPGKLLRMNSDIAAVNTESHSCYYNHAIRSAQLHPKSFVLRMLRKLTFEIARPF